MELYFHPMSGNSRRVVALLQHLELAYTPHVVDLAAGEQRSPEYLALNPNGRVPTLVEDGRALWESAAILQRLAREHAPALLGEDGARVEVDRWIAWALSHLSPALSRLNAETGLRRMRGLEPAPERVAEASREVATLLSLLDAHLATQPYLAGDGPLLPEFVVAPSLEASMGIAKLDLEPYPHLRAWLARTTTLPGWPARPAAKPS